MHARETAGRLSVRARAQQQQQAAAECRAGEWQRGRRHCVAHPAIHAEGSGA